MTREWVAEQDVLFAEIGRLRQQLTEARAMYTGAQEDLNESVGIIVALRTERDYARAEARTLGQRVQEAEAELADLERALDGDEYVQRMRRAEAALARVRALCHPDVARPSKVTVYKARILAAIEREQP